MRVLKIRVKHVAVAIIQSTDITHFKFARLAHTVRDKTVQMFCDVGVFLL